jgi:hypothetical protein
LLVLVLVGAWTSTAAAGTSYVDGISDQNLGEWSGNYLDGSGSFSIPFPSFFSAAWVGPSAGHLHYARFVTAPDAIAQGGACEQNLVNWLRYATSLQLIPVIAVWDVTEGGCVNHGLPSTAAYTADITQLLGYLDTLGSGPVPYLEAWNEPNSSGVSAAQAAAYWTAASTVCQADACTAIAGDFVDNDPDQGSQAFAPGCAAGLTFNSHLKPFETSYVKALGAARPAIWGFHPYYAVNCEQSASVATFEQNLPTPSGQIWFTEVGAWECRFGQATPRGPTRQQSDASFLVNTLMSPTSPAAPAHVFYYEMAPFVYTQSCSKYADSALYMGVTAPGSIYARPAAATIYGPDSTLAGRTGTATSVSGTSATLNGTYTPGGIYEAAVSFQYGRTTSYGSQTPVVQEGPGLAPRSTSATISGLAARATYHFRIVVTDVNGLSEYGTDATMRTS